MDAVSDSISVLSDEQLAAYTLEDADKLVLSADRNLQAAARIYKREGLTQKQMVERLGLLGVKTSVSSIKRVFAKLRAEGEAEFQKPELSQNPSSVRSRKHYESVRRDQIEPTGQPEPLPTSEPPTIEWSSELYLAINHQINDFLDKLEQIPTDHLREGEWDQLALRGEEITKFCRCHIHNLQRDHGSIPEF